MASMEFEEPQSPGYITQTRIARLADTWVENDRDDLLEKQSDIRNLLNGSYSVLVVDDDPVNLQVLVNQLTLQNFSISQAIDCETAPAMIEKADSAGNGTDRSNKINLVIMDIGMPGMGGHKCFQEIIGMNPSAKVVIASGYSTSEQIKKALEAGAAGYLSKPFELNDLLNKVRTVLDEVD